MRARPLTIALVAVWGLGFGAVPVAAQSWMAQAMPANVEGGLALFVSALQGSLAAGSAAGGVIYDARGPGGALGLAAAVAAAGSLALLGRAGAAISSPPAGTVDAVGPGVTGTSAGDGVTALLFGLGGYAEYAVASIWARKPDAVSWIDAAALPSSAEAAVGVLRQLDVQSGETLLLFGGGGSVGIIATQLAVAWGIKVISALGEHDETLARELGATPVRYGAGVAGRVRALGAVDAVFDAAGKGVLADAIALAGGPKRVITLSDPAAADFGVTLSAPTPDRAPGALDDTMPLLADGRLRLRARKSMPMQQAADAHRQLESGNVHQRIILALE